MSDKPRRTRGRGRPIKQKERNDGNKETAKTGIDTNEATNGHISAVYQGRAWRDRLAKRGHMVEQLEGIEKITYQLDATGLNFRQLFAHIETLEALVEEYTILADNARRRMINQLLMNGSMSTDEIDEETGEIIQVMIKSGGRYNREKWQPLFEILDSKELDRARLPEVKKNLPPQITPARWDMAKVKMICGEREKAGLPEAQQILDDSWDWDDPVLVMTRTPVSEADNDA